MEVGAGIYQKRGSGRKDDASIVAQWVSCIVVRSAPGKERQVNKEEGHITGERGWDGMGGGRQETL